MDPLATNGISLATSTMTAIENCIQMTIVECLKNAEEQTQSVLIYLLDELRNLRKDIEELKQQICAPAKVKFTNTTNQIVAPTFTTATIENCIRSSMEQYFVAAEERNNKLMLKLVEEVGGLREEIAELKNRINVNVSAVKSLSSFSVLPREPFRKFDDFIQFDKSIQDDDAKFLQMKIELKMLCTTNGQKFVKVCWRKLFTDDVAERLSWRGTADKMCARSLTTTMAIRSVFIDENGGSEEDFVNACKAFFQFAKHRQNQRQSYVKKVDTSVI